MAGPEEFKNWGGKEVEPSIGLAPDYINAWMFVGQISLGATDPREEIFAEYALERLQEPILTYEEYLRETQPADAERIIAASDQKKIEAVNTLVKEFNEARARLVATKDYRAMKEFFTRIDVLVRGKKES